MCFYLFFFFWSSASFVRGWEFLEYGPMGGFLVVKLVKISHRDSFYLGHHLVKDYPLVLAWVARVFRYVCINCGYYGIFLPVFLPPGLRYSLYVLFLIFFFLFSSLHTLFVYSLCSFVLIHTPCGLFHFLHIFYLMRVRWVFLCGVQIFGSCDIWMSLRCMF